LRRYLVVANQTLAGHHLLDHVRACLADGPCWFYVVVPATPIHEQLEPTGADARVLARCRLEAALARFAAEGATVTGAVGDANPLRAIAAVLRRYTFDEIILSTLPAGTSQWLLDELPSRVADATGLRVTHLVAHGQRVPDVLTA